MGIDQAREIGDYRGCCSVGGLDLGGVHVLTPGAGHPTTQCRIRMRAHRQNLAFVAHSGAGVEQNPENRRVAEPLRREVFKRDESRCGYVSPEGHRCRAAHFVEVDHVVPVAKSGLTKLSNLRLLCRTQNRMAAEDTGLPMGSATAGPKAR